MATKIYCDGSAAYACFIVEGQRPVVVDNLDGMTHNESEYWAIDQALVAARGGYSDVEILTDSQLVVRQLKHTAQVAPARALVSFAPSEREYKIQVPALFRLAWGILMICKDFDHVTFTWVPREQNKAGQELERRRKHVSKEKQTS